MPDLLLPVTLSHGLRAKSPLAADALMIFSDAVQISILPPATHPQMLRLYYRRHPLLGYLHPQRLTHMDALLPLSRDTTSSLISAAGMPTVATALLLSRYIALSDWDAISDSLYYSTRHTLRIHASACTRLDAYLRRTYPAAHTVTSSLPACDIVDVD